MKNYHFDVYYYVFRFIYCCCCRCESKKHIKKYGSRFSKLKALVNAQKDSLFIKAIFSILIERELYSIIHKYKHKQNVSEGYGCECGFGNAVGHKYFVNIKQVFILFVFNIQTFRLIWIGIYL